MKVFEPFKINQMELKNRMVVSAMEQTIVLRMEWKQRNLLPIMNIKQKVDGD